jgi:hypothetical protein
MEIRERKESSSSGNSSILLLISVLWLDVSRCLLYIHTHIHRNCVGLTEKKKTGNLLPVGFDNTKRRCRMLVLLVVVSFFPSSFLSISRENKEKCYQHLSRLFVIKRPSFKCPVHIEAQQKGAAFSAVLQSPTATKLDANRTISVPYIS